jgi:DNA-binding response OmpR family regulator
MTVWLGQLGWHVEHASSGEDALRLAMAKPPDMMTVDVMLPGMDGWTLLKRLRDQEALARVPILIVSVVASESQGRALGATAVVNKPLSQDDLLHALRKNGLMASSLRVVMLTGQHPSILEIRQALEREGHVVQVVHNRKDLEVALACWHPDVAVFDLSFADHLAFDVLTVSREQEAPPFILALQGDNQWLCQSAMDHGKANMRPLEESRVLLDIMKQADLSMTVAMKHPD